MPEKIKTPSHQQISATMLISSIVLYLFSLFISEDSVVLTLAQDIGYLKSFEVIIVFSLIIPLIIIFKIKESDQNSRFMVQRSTLVVFSILTTIFFLECWQNLSLAFNLSSGLRSLGDLALLVFSLGLNRYFIVNLAKSYDLIRPEANVKKITLRYGLIAVAAVICLFLSLFISIIAILTMPVLSSSIFYMPVVIVTSFLILMVITPYAFRIALMAKKLGKGPLVDGFAALGKKFGYKNLQIWVVPSLGEKNINGMQVGLSGLGSRIFLYETLLDLESFSDREMEAVLAHELTHAKKRHIPRLMILMAIMFSAISALSIFITHNLLKLPDTLGEILNVLMIVPTLMAYAFFQRKFEFEADKGAADHGYKAEIISVLDKMTGKNRGIKKYPRLLSLFVSHADFEGRKKYIEQLKGTTCLNKK